MLKIFVYLNLCGTDNICMQCSEPDSKHLFTFKCKYRHYRDRKKIYLKMASGKSAVQPYSVF